jgi:hypothetical protein
MSSSSSPLQVAQVPASDPSERQVPESQASASQLIGMESYGLRFAIGSDVPELFARMDALVPPGANRIPVEMADRTIQILREDDGYRVVFEDGGLEFRCFDPEHAITLLEGQIRQFVAGRTLDHYFINAGVVAIDGRAIILPGISLTGKSTLVAALLDRGAVYYSDEFAVLDDDGLVHPFAGPLKIRGAAPRLPGARGEGPVPVGLVARLPYRRTGTLRTTRISRAEGTVMVMEYQLSTLSRPSETLEVLRKVSSNAVFIDGERGEVDEAADALLELLHGRS